jgi:hypothetical protein
MPLHVGLSGKDEDPHGFSRQGLGMMQKSQGYE